jgi:hypothetical protein
MVTGPTLQRAQLDYKEAYREQRADRANVQVKGDEHTTESVTIKPQDRSDAAFDAQVQKLYPKLTLDQLNGSPELQKARDQWVKGDKPVTFPFLIHVPPENNALAQKNATPPKDGPAPPKQPAPVDSKAAIAGMNAIVQQYPADQVGASVQNEKMGEYVAGVLHDHPELAKDLYKATANRPDFWPNLIMHTQDPAQRGTIATSMWSCLSAPERQATVGNICRWGDSADHDTIMQLMLPPQSKEADMPGLVNAYLGTGKQWQTLIDACPTPKGKEQLANAYLASVREKNGAEAKLLAASGLDAATITQMYATGDFSKLGATLDKGLLDGTPGVIQLLTQAGPISDWEAHRIGQDPKLAADALTGFEKSNDKASYQTLFRVAMESAPLARERLMNDAFGTPGRAANVRQAVVDATFSMTNEAGIMSAQDFVKNSAQLAGSGITPEDLKTWYTTGAMPEHARAFFQRVADGKGSADDKQLALALVDVANMVFSDRVALLEQDSALQAKWGGIDGSTGIVHDVLMLQKTLTAAPVMLPADIRADQPAKTQIA